MSKLREYRDRKGPVRLAIKERHRPWRVEMAIQRPAKDLRVPLEDVFHELGAWGIAILSPSIPAESAGRARRAAIEALCGMGGAAAGKALKCLRARRRRPACD